MSNRPTKYQSKKELAAMYGIPVRLFSKEVTEAKVFLKKGKDYYKTRRLFSPADIQKIFEALGEPVA